MTCIAVQCPHCHSEQIVKRGKTARGTQRYLCQNIMCTAGSFLLDYRNRGYVPEVKRTIIDMSLNASGVRDTARVLRISTDTVLSELKKKEPVLESVNTALLSTRKRDEITVGIERAGEAEMDEMWSFIGKKKEQRWLWHAIDHLTGAVLAYVFGRRQDEVFLKLKGLLEPFGITQYYTDYWGAYTRHLDPDVHRVWLKYSVASRCLAMIVAEQSTEALPPHHVPRLATNLLLLRDQLIVETLMIG